MQRWRAGVVLALILAGAWPTFAQSGPGAALANLAHYWDLGLSIRYPAEWGAPAFIAGQLVLAPDPTAALRGALNQPLVALRIVDPARELGLPKDATFEQIAIAVNLTGQRLTVPETGETTVAGLPAGFAVLSAQHTDGGRLAGQSIAFMLPDGRIGALIGLAARDVWAEFAPTFDTMRLSAAIIRPSDFSAPQFTEANMGAKRGVFPQALLRYALPDGWSERSLGENARLYHDSALTQYADNSGFVNGPQLVVLIVPLAAGNAARDALAQLVGITGTEAAQITETRIGGKGAAAVQYQFTDQITSQNITLTGLPIHSSGLLAVFRWSTPGALVEVTRPAYEKILSTVELLGSSATLVPRGP